MSALAVMVICYLAAWLDIVGGLAGMMNDDGYPMSVVVVPLVAAVFSTVALFAVVLPFALLVRWAMRRFHLHKAAPFLLFLGAAEILTLPLALRFSDGNPRSTLIWGTAYLLAGCSVLWWISFSHEDVAS
ncbi:MAG: hypothetical protein ABIP76_14900 [Verrucomicrobiota bacterium]